MPKLDVYGSGGYYIGTYCACGPYTRESGYYRNRELAQADLDSGTTAAERSAQHHRPQDRLT